jgi:hypothetical protein
MGKLSTDKGKDRIADALNTAEFCMAELVRV